MNARTSTHQADRVSAVAQRENFTDAPNANVQKNSRYPILLPWIASWVRLGCDVFIHVNACIVVTGDS
jgi:hypothetical protein